MMPNNLATKNIDQLLAEAEELIQQINSDVIKDMQEEHRLQFEKHAQNLKKIKSEVQGQIEKKGTSEISSSAEAMREAIQDIVKAIQNFATIRVNDPDLVRDLDGHKVNYSGHY